MGFALSNVGDANMTTSMLQSFGGRVAEEMTFGAGKITTGAGNDIERATAIARRMVTQYGMSELGPIAYGENEETVFLGREVTRHQAHSPDTTQRIDAAVESFAVRDVNIDALATSAAADIACGKANQSMGSPR